MYKKGFVPCQFCRGIGVIPSEFNLTTCYCVKCGGTGYLRKIQ